jgi:hypothetical protein
LKIKDIAPTGLSWHDETVIIRAWVDLRPEESLGDFRNKMRVLDAVGYKRTLFYFPEHTVLVVKEKPC